MAGAFRNKLRTAIANYIQSEGEGCNHCLKPSHRHSNDKQRLGKLLDVEKSPTTGKYDFDKYTREDL